MSDFDPFDDELGAALRRRAGAGTTSTRAAHDAVLRRAGTVRRRRAAIGGGGAMAVLAVGGIMLLPRGADEIEPAVTGDVLPTIEEPSTTVTVTVPAPDTTDDTTGATVDLSIPPVVAPTSLPDSGSSVPTAMVDSSSPGSTSSSPAVVAPSSSSPSTTAAPSSAPTSSAPSDPVPTLAPFTNTYQSAGGSITVSWNGSALALQAVSPVAGFAADIEDSSATRVRVRFEGPVEDSRIEVRVSDGQVLVDID